MKTFFLRFKLYFLTLIQRYEGIYNVLLRYLIKDLGWMRKETMECEQEVNEEMRRKDC